MSRLTFVSNDINIKADDTKNYGVSLISKLMLVTMERDRLIKIIEQKDLLISGYQNNEYRLNDTVLRVTLQHRNMEVQNKVLTDMITKQHELSTRPMIHPGRWES